MHTSNFVQIELKVKAVEARFEEEKLIIQRDHEELLKQVQYIHLLYQLNHLLLPAYMSCRPLLVYS